MIIFFKLLSPVYLMLSPPKAPLYGYPMTMIIVSTMFCCHAVLVNEIDNDGDDGIGDVNHTHDHVLLFSVIIAPALHPKQGRLISSVQHCMSPTGWE